MLKSLAWIAIAASLTGSVCHSQPLSDQVSFKSSEARGLRLYGVSVFSGYSSSAYPLGFGLGVIPGADKLGADTTYGASATVGWQYRRKWTSVAALYSGSYGGMVRYSDLNAFSHSLNLNVSRGLSPKWSLLLSGSAQDSTLPQFVFQPSSLSVVTHMPISFDDLAAAFSIGQFSNAQAASVLTAAPLLDSPARSLLLGERILSYSLQASVSYARSSRLSFHFASFSAGGQHRSSEQRAGAQPRYAMPRSLGANASMNMSYSLSPRTQVGIGVDAGRLWNQHQSGYVTTARASVGRKMGMRWFLTLHAGGSIAHMTQSPYGMPRRLQAVGGGSIGFRTYRHTFAGTYDRSSSDSYGFAVGTITNTSGSWSWRRPGSRWGIFSSAGQQQIRNARFISVSGWQTAGGVTAGLIEGTNVTTQYAFFSSTGSYFGNFSNLRMHSVRVSFGWTPHGSHR